MKELIFNRGQEAPAPVYRTRFGGQWEYHFNFAVKQEGDEFVWLSVVTPAGWWDRGAAIRSMIRARYSADDVEAIINNVLNAPTDVQRVAEYRELQQWRAMAKRSAAECMAWGEANGVCEEVSEQPQDDYHDDSVSSVPDGIEQMMQAVSLAKDQAAELPDEKAATVPALFPAWADKIGEAVAVGERLYYDGRLWKVLQAHTVQAGWTPDVTPSLFAEVAADQDQGTQENPIPYNGNMELEEGKYYSQDGVTYLCIRSTGVPVYNALRDLVGIYVQVA